MILGIEKEFAIFLRAIFTGNLLCFVYYALCVLRKLFPHKLAVISAEDVIFWIGAGLYVFREIDLTSDGMIRWYFVFGLCFGALMAYRLVRKIREKYIAKFGKRE